jgi:dTDP-4-amino-4,6-dideoxygalactose transaminase
LAPSLFPHSRNAAETALSLPIHPYLGDEEIQQIIDDVRGSFAGAR